jgi:hypothetical protein
VSLSAGETFSGVTAKGVRTPGSADVVVGVLSCNNERTIGRVLGAVDAGLHQYFPQARAVVIILDAGSTDGTRWAAQQAAGDKDGVLLVSHPADPARRFGILPGKGGVLRAIFQAAERLGARACVVVDAGLSSISPEWMDLLLRPVLHAGYDYVVPCYRRHKYSGTLTTSLVYPLTRALYGQRIRQPVAEEVGVSGRLAAHYLKQDFWETDLADISPEIWMTTAALCGGYHVCESFLGPRIRDGHAAGPGLGATLTHTAGAMFRLMEAYARRWMAGQGSRRAPVFGSAYGVEMEPVDVDVEGMIGQFRRGLRDLGEVWQRILHPATARELAGLGSGEPHAFCLPDALWVRIVYDFAAAWRQRRMHRHHLLGSLPPLYLARAASFVIETRESFAEEVEDKVERLCRVFEEWKPYLIGQWRAAPVRIQEDRAHVPHPTPGRAFAASNGMRPGAGR